MSSLLNREPYKERKPRENDGKSQELIKNQECVSCKKMFECKGKPRGIDRCLNYEERKTL